MWNPERIPLLHAVTDDAVVARDGFLERAGEVLAAGGTHVALHLRAPGASGRRVYDLAARLAELAAGTGSLLLVNDRVDVALAAGSHGVQLGRRSLSAADVRRLVGAKMLIGASVHGRAEGREAAEDGPDFLLAGAVYPTATHPGQPGGGIRLIESLVALDVPVIAIGGVTPERAGELRRAGAAGMAAIRGIWDAPSPAEAVQRTIEAWQS
ncbi:MAG TPA: thiamine phosphate synthase [Longimicrobium sp.]|nr:thiamine phosphate synthase [Longimicrobium sp.]